MRIRTRNSCAYLLPLFAQAGRHDFPMSGGHWEYRQHAINDLLDGVRRDINSAGKVDEFGHRNPDDPRLMAGLRLAEILLKASEQLVHDLDWCLSGDTDPDTLEANMQAWREKYVLSLRRAMGEAPLLCLARCLTKRTA